MHADLEIEISIGRNEPNTDSLLFGEVEVRSQVLICLT